MLRRVCVSTEVVVKVMISSAGDGRMSAGAYIKCGTLETDAPVVGYVGHCRSTITSRDIPPTFRLDDTSSAKEDQKAASATGDGSSKSHSMIQEITMGWLTLPAAHNPPHKHLPGHT
mgnify:CR=1 FL=1